MQFPQGCIAILAKAPVAGLAKTRLIPALGAEKSAQLQQLFIEHSVNTCIRADIAPVHLWCAPDSSHPHFQSLARKYPLTLHNQGNGDLGEKMFGAISASLQHASFVIVIGTDCPELDIETLQQSANMLVSNSDTDSSDAKENGHDNQVVLAPATDGGYVLIGLNRVERKLFTDIPWSTDQVMHATRQQLHQLQWHWEELRTFSDIDVPEDLKLLNQANFPIYAEI